jgi:hypothetical protein
MKKICPLCICGLLTSCTHYYYVPNVQNVPLFHEASEVRLTGSVGGGEESSCAEFQGAVSFSDHFAMVGNFMHAENSENKAAQGNLVELGGGYFKPVTEHFVFELYSGAGYSDQIHHYDEKSWSTLNFTRFFAQPSIGFSHNAVDLIFSARIQSAIFSNIHDNTDMNEGVGSLKESPVLNSIEPAFTMRFGWKYVKAQFQYLCVIPDGHRSIIELTHLSFGLQVAIAQRFRDNKQY